MLCFSFDFSGDLSFEEFSKTSLVEELMASDEVESDAEGTEKEESSADREIDEHSLSAQDIDDPSAGTTEELAESFATELSSIQTARKRNLMTTSLSVRNVSVYVSSTTPFLILVWVTD